ncbi:competence type IV pilus minor pilin ComGF [Streptococcus orisasini]
MLKNKLKAFTLLECLVALLVIAGSVSVYNGLTKIISSNVRYLSENQEDKWLLFCQQFRSELEGTNLQKLDDYKLYISKDGQNLAFGKSKATDFRKTNADGRGFQPMLTGIKSAYFSKSKQIVKLNITFDNGLEKVFVYAFDEKS